MRKIMIKEEHLELKEDLLAAIANKESHQQIRFNCGTSCCIAGNKVIKDFPELIPLILSGEEMGIDDRLVGKGLSCDAIDAWEAPWTYAQSKYCLNDNFANLVFDEDGSYLDHLVAVDLIDLNCMEGVEWVNREKWVNRESEDFVPYSSFYCDENHFCWASRSANGYNYKWDGLTLLRQKKGEPDVVIYQKGA